MVSCRCLLKAELLKRVNSGSLLLLLPLAEVRAMSQSSSPSTQYSPSASSSKPTESSSPYLAHWK